MNLARELLQIALGCQTRLSAKASPREWELAGEFCRQQMVFALAYRAMCSLPACQQPDACVRDQWREAAEAQAVLNEILYAEAPKVKEYFATRGLRACILKGAAYARFYEDPLSRHVGDIDIWVPGPRKKTLAAIREHYQVTDILFQECKMHLSDSTIIDVHFLPGKFSNPVLHRRFLHFVRRHEAEAASLYPGIAFDLVYCPVHMFRHVPRGGIRFKQLVDYWYILHTATPDARKEAWRELCKLGMKGFIGELMYVMQRCLLLEASCMLCPPDARNGARLLEEIVRNTHSVQDPGAAKLRHILRFLPRYPREILWAFYGKAIQYLWRRLHGYR